MAVAALIPFYAATELAQVDFETAVIYMLSLMLVNQEGWIAKDSRKDFDDH